MSDVHTGGCQCGAVRFRVSGTLGKASICHCRMCQKAFGGFYAPLVSVARETDLVWTRAEPKRFQSSNVVARGFCPECGTPLTYEAPDGIALAIGAFDEPNAIAPVIQYGVEGKLPYTDHMADISARTTEDDFEALAFLASIVSNQHPDHDTDTWTPVQPGETDNG
ncbi:GFA family protein [Labrenzia sp. OB1]|uniref:GFA family protein n=1 Tax=Labrenzia sp. OB1 TaxID=1561204 RepID=UPI0007B262D9|nr:GFA family protein [Labrenzia sp. OB1]KZM47817.1 aldehyde-activating protein [Labrenzia sp. OB1]